MTLLEALSRRIHGMRGAVLGPGAGKVEPPPVDRDYGAQWVPTDETEAMDQILNISDPEAFEAAGHHDAEHVIGPLVQRTDAVLDLGCGIGRVTRYVAPLCREIWAVDVSETMLDMARRRLAGLPNVRFVLGDGASLPGVPSEGIDVVYSFLTLQHVEREHAFLLLREVRRVLRAGGVAYLTFPNLLSDVYLGAFVQYAESGEVRNPARARFYTPEEVRQILTAAGLEVEQLDAGVEILVTCRKA
jgi:ubiquinone/menaquinone biosynthesis C-methylase UbiE